MTRERGDELGFPLDRSGELGALTKVQIETSIQFDYRSAPIGAFLIGRGGPNAAGWESVSTHAGPNYRLGKQVDRDPEEILEAGERKEKGGRLECLKGVPAISVGHH